MAAKCKKCDPHEICEECPEWIFTLADLIMCMMGLFVLLWVLKPSPSPPPKGTDGEPSKEQAKMNEVISEIRQAFGYVPDPNSGDPIDQAAFKKVMRLAGNKNQGLAENRQESPEGPDPMATTIRPGKQAVIGGRVQFGRGETALTDANRKVLDGIANEIKGRYVVVVLKGHAARDDADAAQHMDLSVKRAQAAADYLVSQGVSPAILRVQGCGAYEPVRERAYSADRQAINRRVEVFATDVLVRDLQDPRTAGEAPLD